MILDVDLTFMEVKKAFEDPDITLMALMAWLFDS